MHTPATENTFVFSILFICTFAHLFFSYQDVHIYSFLHIKTTLQIVNIASPNKQNYVIALCKHFDKFDT